jgi:hypothetical protein
MVFWQQANSSPIRSFLLILQLSAAIVNSQPSGINPSKNGKSRLLLYAFLVTGIWKAINDSG